MLPMVNWSTTSQLLTGTLQCQHGDASLQRSMCSVAVSIDGQVTHLHGGFGREDLTSSLFANHHYVLKKAAKIHQNLLTREACVLQKLSGSPSAPRLLCVGSNMMVTENAGRPLSVSNIPPDYRTQAEAILRDLESRGIAHHDLFKHDSTSAFQVEFLVSVRGSLKIVDFGIASVSGSYACAKGMPHTVLGSGAYDRAVDTSRDSDVLGILDAMSRANQTLDSYSSAGIRAEVGVCAQPFVSDLLRARRAHHLTSNSRSIGPQGPVNSSTDFGEFESFSSEASLVSVGPTLQVARATMTRHASSEKRCRNSYARENLVLRSPNTCGQFDKEPERCGASARESGSRRAAM